MKTLSDQEQARLLGQSPTLKVAKKPPVIRDPVTLDDLDDLKKQAQTQVENQSVQVDEHLDEHLSEQVNERLDEQESEQPDVQAPPANGSSNLGKSWEEIAMKENPQPKRRIKRASYQLYLDQEEAIDQIVATIKQVYKKLNLSIRQASIDKSALVREALDQYLPGQLKKVEELKNKHLSGGNDQPPEQNEGSQ